MGNDAARISVWRFVDGKPGHDRQSAGLVAALKGQLPIAVTTFEAGACPVGPLDYVLARFPPAAGLTPPALIIGAGRACQWPMIVARRACGGRSVYLMKPAWPIACFDLCVIPRHDAAPKRPGVFTSEGVLNDIIAAPVSGDGGLILVGGPSPHFGWDSAAVLQQIDAVIAAAPAKSWTITDSRRTPPATSQALSALAKPPVEFVSAKDTDRSWLNGQFRRADTIWVCRDSVSMIYEALASNAAIGILEIPVLRNSRITRITEQLAARGSVTRFDDWRAGQALATHAPLREAERCASAIVKRLFGES